MRMRLLLPAVAIISTGAVADETLPEAGLPIPSILVMALWWSNDAGTPPQLALDHIEFGDAAACEVARQKIENGILGEEPGLNWVAAYCVDKASPPPRQ